MLFSLYQDEYGLASSGVSSKISKLYRRTVPVESSTILHVDLSLLFSLYCAKSFDVRPISVAVLTVPLISKSGDDGTSSKNMFSPII